MTSVLLIWLAAVGADAQAAKDVPLAERPYRAVVCLRFADDPTLTPLFVDAVQRQVRDQLTNYFGPLAEIEVLTGGHWLIDEFAGQPIDEPPLTPQLLLDRQVNR